MPGAQGSVFTFPRNPVFASEPYCLSPGPMAIAKNGVYFFDPLTHQGRNAVEGDDGKIFNGNLCNFLTVYLFI